MDGKQQEQVFSYESRELEIGEVSFLQNVKQFSVLSLEHIFMGYDHILFVISLLFGVKTIRHILALVTAFTIAHSITLALATFDIVQLPGRFIESAIALSIIYVALINIFNQDSIGIEIGQLLIVSLAFPIILWIKKLQFKQATWVIPGTSVAILAFGLVWFIQRAF